MVIAPRINDTPAVLTSAVVEDDLKQLGGIVGRDLYEKAAPTLLARIGFWAQRHGLTHADVKEVCRLMVRPKTLADITFHTELLAKFAGLVELVVSRRKAREQQDRDRAEAKAAEEQFAANRETVSQLLGGITSRFGTFPSRRANPRSSTSGKRDQEETAGQEGRGEETGDEG